MSVGIAARVAWRGVAAGQRLDRIGGSYCLRLKGQETTVTDSGQSLES
jgi:hypothetical protein